jgi:hypothetical protein
MSEHDDLPRVVRLTPEESATFQARVAETDARLQGLDDERFLTRLEARREAARRRIAANRFPVRGIVPA